MPSIEMLTRVGLMTTVTVVVGFSVLGALLKKPAPDTIRIATITPASPVASDGVGFEPASARAISHATTAVPGDGLRPESVAVPAISYLTIDEPAPAVRNATVPPAKELTPAVHAPTLPPATTEDALAPSRPGALLEEQQPATEANISGGVRKADRPAPPGRSVHVRKPKQARVRAVPFSYGQSLGA